MIDPDVLLLFVPASIALVVVPGPAVLYIVTRSVTQGRAAGVASALGVQAGGAVHVLAAAAGVSALLASSATAFDAVRYGGAAYLVIIGVRRLLGRGGDEGAAASPGGASRRRLAAHGAVVNILNPKTAMFFLAFLPQFVDPARGSATLQVLLLGGIFLVVATISDGAYALLAGTVARRLRGAPGAGALLTRLSGGVYVGLGITAALTGQRPARAS